MIFEIKFLDYWHLSSGLSAGAKLNNTVTKDKNGLPYVPGKTLKGLIKEQSSNENFKNVCFGKEGKKIGKCYFGDAFIEDETKNSILEKNLKNQLFDEITSTKINENGIAQSGSLREIEVVIPISLYGQINNIPDEYKKEMISCLKKVKRMGLNRNRGLGRCTIQIIGEDK